MSELASASKLLIVEAESQLRSSMLSLFDNAHFEVTGASDHAEALHELAKQSFDILVMELPPVPSPDEHAPSEAQSIRTANALRCVRQIREIAPRTPIVLTTHAESEPAACEALLQGAASYVPKNLVETTLVETVDQVLKVSRAARDATQIDDCVSRVKLTLTLPSHESLVPSVIGKLETATAQLGLFDEMVWTQVAMALDEAILNAMIHGNLEVESALREDGDGQAYWDKIALHRSQSPYAERRTEVTLTATRTQAVFVIKDQGPGFDANSVPDPTDPANLESIGGRGLLLINAFMDEIHHNERGNELTMIKRKSSGERDDYDD